MPHDLSFSLTKPNVKPSKIGKVIEWVLDADQQFRMSKKTHAFVEGSLRLVASCSFTISCKLRSSNMNMKLRKAKPTKTYENWLEFSLSKGIQGRASQWSSNMAPHLYKAISFMRIPGCLQTVRGVHDGAWFSCSIQHYISIRVDFSPNALSSWLLLLRTSTDCSKRPEYSVNLSDWCDCFYLFLNTIVTHNASLFKHGPWPPPCPQPCTWRPNASDLSVQPWKSGIFWSISTPSFVEQIWFLGDVITNQHGDWNRTMWCSISRPLVSWHSFSQWSLTVQNSARPLRTGYSVFLRAS